MIEQSMNWAKQVEYNLSRRTQSNCRCMDMPKAWNLWGCGSLWQITLPHKDKQDATGDRTAQFDLCQQLWHHQYRLRANYSVRPSILSRSRFNRWNEIWYGVILSKTLLSRGFNLFDRNWISWWMHSKVLVLCLQNSGPLHFHLSSIMNCVRSGSRLHILVCMFMNMRTSRYSRLRCNSASV